MEWCRVWHGCLKRSPAGALRVQRCLGEIWSTEAAAARHFVRCTRRLKEGVWLQDLPIQTHYQRRVRGQGRVGAWGIDETGMITGLLLSAACRILDDSEDRSHVCLYICLHTTNRLRPEAERLDFGLVYMCQEVELFTSLPDFEYNHTNVAERDCGTEAVSGFEQRLLFLSQSLDLLLFGSALNSLSLSLLLLLLSCPSSLSPIPLCMFFV